jgi:hypothetical protein
MVGLGLIWLFIAPSRRLLGLAVLGFYASFLFASAVHAYPMGMGRPDIFAFPVAIVLFVAGIAWVTAWLPRPEVAQLAVAIVAAALALFRPIGAAYWAVDDSHLVSSLSAVVSDRDGMIISADGTYLVAHYGAWPVRLSSTSGVSHGTRAEIERDRTLYVPERKKPGRMVERFLDTAGPERVWYVAFRTKTFEGVAATLLRRGYDLQLVEHTRKGALYLAVQSAKPVPVGS